MIATEKTVRLFGGNRLDGSVEELQLCAVVELR